MTSIPSFQRAALLASVLVFGFTANVVAQLGGASGSYDGAAAVPIANADQAAAREKALALALHDAVLGAVAGLLGADEAAARQSQLERTVLARSRSFVTGYQVVDEGAEGGEYRVAVQAHVAVDSVRRALDDLEAPQGGGSAVTDAPDAASGVESSADVHLRGNLTAARLRSIRNLLERQVPGVRAVSVQSLEAGAINLRLRGAFPAHALSGYLSHADFGSFRLEVTPAEVGPDLEVVVQDAEAPR